MTHHQLTTKSTCSLASAPMVVLVSGWKHTGVWVMSCWRQRVIPTSVRVVLTRWWRHIGNDRMRADRSVRSWQVLTDVDRYGGVTMMRQLIGELNFVWHWHYYFLTLLELRSLFCQWVVEDTCHYFHATSDMLTNFKLFLPWTVINYIALLGLCTTTIIYHELPSTAMNYFQLP